MRVAYSARRLSARISQMGRAISRDYAGRTVHVVAILENSFLFAADLVRKIRPPVVCHFLRSELRDVKFGGFPRREVFFSSPPALGGRDVLVVDSILHSGVTQDFLLKRLEEAQPRSLRLAVLFDKAEGRKVNIRPAYTGFAAASKHWVGYGLPGRGGLYRNLSFVGVAESRQKQSRRGRRQTGS